jgi:hypothetical protein
MLLAKMMPRLHPFPNTLSLSIMPCRSCRASPVQWNNVWPSFSLPNYSTSSSHNCPPSTSTYYLLHHHQRLLFKTMLQYCHHFPNALVPLKIIPFLIGLWVLCLDKSFTLQSLLHQSQNQLHLLLLSHLHLPLLPLILYTNCTQSSQWPFLLRYQIPHILPSIQISPASPFLVLS